jgi:hypothetical protein
MEGKRLSPRNKRKHNGGGDDGNVGGENRSYFGSAVTTFFGKVVRLAGQSVGINSPKKKGKRGFDEDNEEHNR